jgi:radical SAM protein with 4Fe4S-binding SPASM domain
LYDIAYRSCTPINVVIETTLRCNLRCVHCYNFDRREPYPRPVLGRELATEELCRVIDEVCEAGCVYLSLSGGEPLVHPDLDTLVRRARTHRAFVRVKTNGELLTAERLGRLQEAGVAGYDVSLYGGRPETHDAFTLEPGSFVATVAGIELARRAGALVRVSICVTRLNYRELADMMEIAERYDCSTGVDLQMTVRHGGDPSPRDLRVDRTVLEELYRGPMAELLAEPDFDPGRSVQCNCARTMAGISSTGDVYPCIGAPIPCGNVRDASFAEIWQSSSELQRIRGLTLQDFPACEPCALRPHCSRSSGAVWLNTGSYTGAEAWTCADAEVRRDAWESRQRR